MGSVVHYKMEKRAWRYSRDSTQMYMYYFGKKESYLIWSWTSKRAMHEYHDQACVLLIQLLHGQKIREKPIFFDLTLKQLRRIDA